MKSKVVKDEIQKTFWIPVSLMRKVEEKLERLRKAGEPHTFKAFMLRLIKNAVE